MTIRGEFTEAGQALARTAPVNLTVQSAANVTGVKGRFVTPERVGIAGVIVRADIGAESQPQTTTDAAGQLHARRPAGGPGDAALRRDAGQSALSDLAVHDDAGGEPGSA